VSGRAVYGWQTSLADLSLILFLVAAAAVDRQRGAASAPSPQAEPLAVYVAGPGAPPLVEWLAAQETDPRQQLTITARYGPEPGAQRRAVEEAMALVEQVHAPAGGARVVVEPGAGPTRAVLAFDRTMAQDLLGKARSR